MESLKQAIHSFVVKIWIEASPPGDEFIKWHGQITHVPSHKQGYFTKLDGVTNFIVPYLEEIGAERGMRFKMKRKLLVWYRSARARISNKISHE